METSRRNLKLLSHALLALVVAFGLVFVFAPTPRAEAHDIGWRWVTWYPGQPDGTRAFFENRTAYYSQEVLWAGYNYNFNTDLYVESVCYGCGGNVVFIQGDFGATGWAALAYPYSSGNPCVNWSGLGSTGYCNTSNHKADFAYVYFNNAYGIFNPPAGDYVARHEAGHVFGLAHTDCSTQSIMRPGNCGSQFTTLTAHDISDINAWY